MQYFLAANVSDAQHTALQVRVTKIFLKSLFPGVQTNKRTSAAEGRLDGVACLGSGYDFKAEMALGEDSHGMSYDLIILHYWKDYVNKHRRVLAKGGIDLAAVKQARSLPVLACSSHCLMPL